MLKSDADNYICDNRLIGGDDVGNISKCSSLEDLGNVKIIVSGSCCWW